MNDDDLFGRGARSWLRIVRVYVRKGRRGGRKVHVTMRWRFYGRWCTLEAETWRPLMKQARARDADRWGAGMDDWRRGFLAIVAETAYRWAFEIEASPERNQYLRDAAAELRKLDCELRICAGRIADGLERRQELFESFGIDAEWSEPGLDLWDMLEEVARLPQFLGTCLDPAAKLGTFLDYMRGTSRETPDLADLMRQVAESKPGKPFATHGADAEALAKAQGSKADSWPDRVRVLFARLATQQWRDWKGQRVTALDCFTPNSLATLACVAAGFNPDQLLDDLDDYMPAALKVEAIEKALHRFRLTK